MLDEKASRLSLTASSLDPDSKRMLKRRYMTEVIVFKQVSIEMSCRDCMAKFVTEQKAAKAVQACDKLVSTSLRNVGGLREYVVRLSRSCSSRRSVRSGYGGMSS